VRGWELDKVAEPALFLLGALAVWHGRSVEFVIVAALATLNRETGALMPLVGLALGAPRRVVVAALIVCLALLAPLRLLGPQPVVDPNLQLERIVYVVGGLCLTPLLAVAWLRTAPPPLQRLFWFLAPVWTVWLLATERLEQGAALLSLVALVFVPITLAGLERSTAHSRSVATHST
jgi:hypothetical protein